MNFIKNNFVWIALAVCFSALLVLGLQTPGTKTITQDDLNGLSKPEQAALKKDVEKENFNKAIQEEASKKTAYDQAIKTMDELDNRWSDAQKIIDATPKIALAQPMGVLQALKREAESQNLPECFAAANKHRVESMNLTLEYMYVFMAEGNAGVLKPDVMKMVRDSEKAKETYTASKQSCI